MQDFTVEAISVLPSLVTHWPTNDQPLSDYSSNNHIFHIPLDFQGMITELNGLSYDPKTNKINGALAAQYTTYRGINILPGVPGLSKQMEGLREKTYQTWDTILRLKLYTRGSVTQELIYSGFDLLFQLRTDRSENNDYYTRWFYSMRLVKLNTINSEQTVIATSSESAFTTTGVKKSGIESGEHATLFNAANIGLYLIRTTYNNEDFWGIYIADITLQLMTNSQHTEYGYWWDYNRVSTGAGMGFAGKIDGLEIDPPMKEDPNDPSDPNLPDGPGEPGGPSGPGGGGGDHDIISDPVPWPDLPTLSATSAGFVTLYCPTIAELQALADEINSETIWDTFKDFFDHAEDYVAGLGIVPCLPDIGLHVYPKFGWFSFDTSMALVTNQYKIVDCGSIHINEFYGSAFDYSPMTSIQIYLPYIGYRDLDVDGCMDHDIAVKYYLDVYSGNCVAMIAIDGIIQYHFSGNCIQQIPVSSQSYDDTIKNGVTLAAAIGTAVATHGASVAASETAAALGTKEATAEAAKMATAATASRNAVVGSTMNGVMNSKPSISRSGALGSSSGMLGVQYPYIIKTIPRQSWPENYQNIAGYPSNMTKTIGSLSGFFVVDSINLSGVPGTESELSEIMSYLKGGAIV